MFWWLEVEMPAGHKKLQRLGQANEAERITRGIRTAAADGTLTDAEITALDAGGQWHIRRNAGDIRITRSVPAEGEYACWAFVVEPPLGPATTVRSERLGNGVCAETGTGAHAYLYMPAKWPTTMFAATVEGGDSARTVARRWSRMTRQPND